MQGVRSIGLSGRGSSSSSRHRRVIDQHGLFCSSTPTRAAIVLIPQRRRGGLETARTQVAGPWLSSASATLPRARPKPAAVPSAPFEPSKTACPRSWPCRGSSPSKRPTAGSPRAVCRPTMPPSRWRPSTPEPLLSPTHRRSPPDPVPPGRAPGRQRQHRQMAWVAAANPVDPIACARWRAYTSIPTGSWRSSMVHTAWPNTDPMDHRVMMPNWPRDPLRRPPGRPLQKRSIDALRKAVKLTGQQHGFVDGRQDRPRTNHTSEVVPDRAPPHVAWILRRPSPGAAPCTMGNVISMAATPLTARATPTANPLGKMEQFHPPCWCLRRSCCRHCRSWRSFALPAVTLISYSFLTQSPQASSGCCRHWSTTSISSVPLYAHVLLTTLRISLVDGDCRAAGLSRRPRHGSRRSRDDAHDHDDRDRAASSASWSELMAGR